MNEPVYWPTIFWWESEKLSHSIRKTVSHHSRWCHHKCTPLVLQGGMVCSLVVVERLRHRRQDDCDGGIEDIYNLASCSNIMYNTLIARRI